MLIIVLIIIFLSTFLLWERFKLRKIINVSNQIKCGFRALPLIGHTHIYGDGQRAMSGIMLHARDAIKNGGLSNLWLASNYYIMVVDPCDIEVISKACLQKDDLMRFARALLGNGSIFAPVSIWRPRRKFLAPTFSPYNLNKFVKIFSKQGEVMADRLSKKAGKGIFSFWNYASSYTLDSVCESAFGVEMSAQKEEGSPLVSAFEEVCKIVHKRMTSPFLYPDTVYKMFHYFKTFKNAKHILCNFVDEIIKEKRLTLKNASLHNKNESEEGVKTFLELLIESSGGEKGYSNMELQEETLVILLAGTDTSAVGASFTAMMLARHEDVQEKVYKELYEVFGDSDRPITAEDLPNLKYLEVVIKECLRLYPPVPITTRKVEADVTLQSGITLVPGCGVLFNIWGIHRNPKYWGEDAEVFRPERFFDAPPTNPIAYMPFSYGPRNCLGYRYAMMSMKTAIALLVRRFRILPSNKDIILTHQIMMKDVNQFPIELESRL